MTAKIFQIIQYLLILNFVISVMLLISGSLFSLSDRYSLFDFNQELYGELASNLKVTMIYLTITEIIICIYCFLTKTTKGFVLAGYFFVLMVISVYFYGQLNNVEIDENLYPFFIYTGVSHILFGMMTDIKKKLHLEDINER
jgi:hypothetical protein